MCDVVVVMAWSDWGGSLCGTIYPIVMDIVRERVAQRRSVPADLAAHPLMTVTASDVAGLSVHRTIKHIVSTVRGAAGSETADAEAAVVVVLLAQLGDWDFRKSVAIALRRCRGESGDVALRRGADVFGSESHESSFTSNLIIAELCVGLGTRSGGFGGDAAQQKILSQWIEGSDAVLCASTQGSSNRDRLNNNNEATCAATPPLYATNAVGPDVSVYVRNLWTDGYRGACLQQYEPLRHLRWAERTSFQFPVSEARAWECLFLGASESFTPVPGGADGARLHLSPQARRWVTEWCCYPQRMVCLVQCGSCSSGERFPLGLLQAAIAREFTTSASPSCLLVPAASYFSYLFLDDVTELHEDKSGAAVPSTSGAHLSAAPLPLTLSGLSAVVGACKIDLQHSRLIASDAYCKATDWLAVLPVGFCVALPPLATSSVASSLSSASHSLQPILVPRQWEYATASHPSSNVTDGLHLLQFGHRRRGELSQRVLMPTALSPPLGDDTSAASGITYACSAEHFRRLVDAETAKIARQYVQGNYLRGASIRMSRLGEWSVLATAQCASSEQKSLYLVEVGTVQGRVVFSVCSCPAFGKQHLCRHGAALCVCLLGVVTNQLEDSLVCAHASGQMPSLVGSEGDAHIPCEDRPRPEKPADAIPFTYVPTAVDVSASGLPSYLVNAAKALDAKRGRGKGPGASAAVSTPRINSAYLQGIGAPKGRRTTPFFYFGGLQRAAVREEHPDWSMTDISKHLGKLWKDMPDGEKAVIVENCKREGDAWDAAWAEYRETDEYKLLLAAVASTSASPNAKRRRTEKMPAAAAEANDHANDDDGDDAAPLERFHAMNPEWRCDENGQWVNDWDARDEGASRSTVSLAPAAARVPRLGSTVRLAARSTQGGGGFASRGMSELETKASLYRSAHLEDEDDEDV